MIVSVGRDHPASVRGIAIVATAGLLLVLSIFGSWTTTGVGSTQSGRELADLFLAGTISAWAPRWVGLGLYLPPLCGALYLIGAGWGGRYGRGLEIGAIAVAALAAVVISAALSWQPIRSPGVGAVMVVGGVSVALLGLVTTTAPLAAEPGA